MYSRVLVPLDGSPLAEQALPLARAIARGMEATITLVRILDLGTLATIHPQVRLNWNQLVAGMHEAGQEYLEGVAAPIRGAGLGVEHHVQEGSPAAVIVTEAGRVPSTLIALTTHGLSGISRWLMGSVTDKVLQVSASPILIVTAAMSPRLPDEAALSTVIVPLDGSAVAEKALPHAEAIGARLGATVLLARVVEVHGGRSAAAENAAAVEYLTRVAGGLRDRGAGTVEHRVIRGDPAGAIVDLADATPDAVVLMTTHGASGPGRWLLGSCTRRVAKHSRSPVLVVPSQRRSRA